MRRSSLDRVRTVNLFEHNHIDDIDGRCCWYRSCTRGDANAPAKAASP